MQKIFKIKMGETTISQNNNTPAANVNNSTSNASNANYNRDDEQTVITHQAMEQKITQMKQNIKTLNLIRRARKLKFTDDGSQNPNVPGQDNGLNAWMDLRMSNSFDMDEEMQIHYAKKNSDRNRFLDIDDVAMKGPRQKEQSHPLTLDQYSEQEAKALAAQAKALINNDNLPICRKTGIRTTSTITSNEADVTPMSPLQRLDQSQTNKTTRPQQRVTKVKNHNTAGSRAATQPQQYEGYRDRYGNKTREGEGDFLNPHEDEMIYANNNDEIQEDDLYDNEEDLTEYEDYQKSYYRQERSPRRPIYKHANRYYDESFHFRRGRRRSPSPYHRTGIQS